MLEVVLPEQVLASISLQVPALGFAQAANADDKAEGSDEDRKAKTVINVASGNHKTEGNGW
jgi:hypothetical protein